MSGGGNKEQGSHLSPARGAYQVKIDSSLAPICHECDRSRLQSVRTTLASIKIVPFLLFRIQDHTLSPNYGDFNGTKIWTQACQ